MIDTSRLLSGDRYQRGERVMMKNPTDSKFVGSVQRALRELIFDGFARDPLIRLNCSMGPKSGLTETPDYTRMRDEAVRRSQAIDPSSFVCTVLNDSRASMLALEVQLTEPGSGAVKIVQISVSRASVLPG